MAKTTIERADPQPAGAGPAEPDQDLSLEEAARILDLAPSLLRLRIEVGDLPAVETGRGLRIRAADFARFKRGYDRQQRALREMIADSEDLIANHGL